MGRLVLAYSGAIFQKMQAGMGDTIFAPYYQVLEKIGVKFRFFHAVKALRLSGAGDGDKRLYLSDAGGHSLWLRRYKGHDNNPETHQFS